MTARPVTSSDLTAAIVRLDATADRMADDLRAAGWTEIDDTESRWRAPDGLTLGLAAAWERVCRDAVSAWRGRPL